MLTYLARRLLLMIPTLIGITVVVFAVIAYSPGGVGGTEIGDEGNMKAEEVKALRDYYDKRFGLNQPKPVQYLRWLNHVAPIGFAVNDDQSLGRWRWAKVPDLGTSFAKSRPVTALIADALPVTLLLNLSTIPITYAVSVATGIYTARRRGGPADVGSTLLFQALWSVPVILGGVLMIGFLANRDYLGGHAFPTGGLHDMFADRMTFLPSHAGGQWDRGWLLDLVWHLALPVACLSYGSFAFQTKLTRRSMLNNLSADYARTARAKGLGDGAVTYRHVFRNSLIPLITASAGLLPALLGGSIIVERIFSLPGMGSLTLEAITTKDRELVLANALITGVLGLASYLVADVLYVAVDPRVSFE